MIDPHLVWIAFFAPLAACVLITFFFLNNKTCSSLLAIAGILISFICSCLVFAQIFQTDPPGSLQQSYAWIHTGALTINFGFLINALAIMMLLIVTGVGSAIFIYARGYMDEDPSAPRFFAELSLFAFSMIGIVLSNNFIQLFIFWELVGLSSYLLIGFWYAKPSAADAGVKAFLVNRLSDFGFLTGIILLWSVSDGGTGRSFQFTDLVNVVPHLDGHLLTIIGLLLFCGVIGKSAQIPLHVWLIDAMEGPTPVSALIHAATMVAAGVYLLSRTFFVFEESPTALLFIAYTGAITSLMAAILAVAENDIKKILAYSTLSQLGLMVMALGLGGPMQGMYHLTTHAFFKALLFLGAGSVICAYHHQQQNIWKMHGLLKQMPITGITFLIGTLALCGIWPLSGFWSKDAILGLAYENNLGLYLIASTASCLTAFYMGRLFWVAFWGDPVHQRRSHEHEIHESPAVMTLPLVFLAVLSAIGGFMGIPHLFFPQQAPEALNIKVAVISSIVALLGLFSSYIVYGSRPQADPLATRIVAFYGVLKNKFYFDIAYTWYVDRIQQTMAICLERFEKIFLVRLCLGGVINLAREGGKTFRYLQNGLVQFYALIFILGVIILFLLMGIK